MECDEYPMLIYIYDTKGRYGKPIRIDNQTQLVPELQHRVFPAIKNGQEVVITDELDQCLLHGKDGQVLHPREVAVMFENSKKENRQ